MAIPERAFFNEKPETRPANLRCGRCQRLDSYPIRWMRRTKKDRVPPNADERDRAMFQKLRDYLVRLDDTVTCKHCRFRIEIPSHQSLIFLEPGGGLPNDGLPVVDEED